ncbi:hypothetical protein DLREEDagrD3_08500 [Denitratisoma sp. agr-D3]
MARATYPLKVFAYSGRENGLMVVGSREALAELASKLQDAAQHLPPASADQWPPEILSYEPKVGPFKNQNDWLLSFHIEGAVPAESRVPLAVSPKMPQPIVISTVVLALVGLWAIIQTVLPNVF